MVIDIKEILAVVCPERYFDSGDGGDFSKKENIKKIKKVIEKAILDSEKKAKEEEAREGIKENSEQKEERRIRSYIDAIYEARKNKLFKFENGKLVGVKAESVHKLGYDSPSETLEPIYFFILDLINDFGFYAEKLVDNFVSSPGSAHFGEIGQRTSILQQQGQKIMGDINTVMRSIINLIYDLREFRIRLQSYDDLKSKDQSIVDAARLSLKQIWMDKVDIVSRGNSSIKAMALGQGGFSTLLDAFLVAKDEKDVDSIDLNDMVKRILKPRIAEFNHWVKYSESELRKRYEIEKNYLKSQFNSLKLYINWARPYLRSAQELQMSENSRHPALVKMFNTLLLQLTLCAKRDFKDVWDDRLGELKMYPSSVPYSKSNKFLEVIFIDFEFRGIPQRTQQGFVSGGKTEITFTSYALTANEFDLFKKIFDKAESDSAFGLIEGATEDSIKQLTKDIDYFLYDKESVTKEEKKKQESKSPIDESNPFLALIGAYNDKTPKIDKKQINSKDAKLEKDYIIPALQETVKEDSFRFFEIYKKVHGMASFP